MSYTLSRTQYIPYELLNQIFCFADVPYKAFVWLRINKACLGFFDKPRAFHPTAHLELPINFVSPFSHCWRWTCIKSLTLLPQTSSQHSYYYFDFNLRIQLTTLCLKMPYRDQNDMVQLHAEYGTVTLANLQHLSVDVGSKSDYRESAPVPYYASNCFSNLQHLELFDMQSIHALEDTTFKHLNVAVLSFSSNSKSASSPACEIDAQALLKIARQAEVCVIFEPRFIPNKEESKFDVSISAKLGRLYQWEQWYIRRHSWTTSGLAVALSTKGNRLKTVHVYTPSPTSTLVTSTEGKVFIKQSIPNCSYAELQLA
jgi:hypothetical protein